MKVKLKDICINIVLGIILLTLLIKINPFNWGILRFLFSPKFMTYSDVSDLEGLDMTVDILTSNMMEYIVVLNILKVAIWGGILFMGIYFIYTLIGGNRNDRGKRRTSTK